MVGQTLVAGVYRFGHATTANLIGNLTLDGSASGASVAVAATGTRLCAIRVVSAAAGGSTNATARSILQYHLTKNNFSRRDAFGKFSYSAHSSWSTTS